MLRVLLRLRGVVLRLRLRVGREADAMNDRLYIRQRRQCRPHAWRCSGAWCVEGRLMHTRQARRMRTSAAAEWWHEFTKNTRKISFDVLSRGRNGSAPTN